jgi:hypothetical protein
MLEVQVMIQACAGFEGLATERLSFPKIISAGNDDVIRTEPVWRTVPDRSMARPSGASLPNPKCVRVSL